MLSRRWIGSLFLALALLQLVPVWAPAYFPTSDGPSHVYNAFVIRELLLHHGGSIADTFAIDWRPHPNVLGHALLAVLLGMFRAAVAEKILVSFIILLFLGSAWLLAGGRVVAFLALPLAHHELLQYGFYNFDLSVGIYLVTVALWWRGGNVAVIALLTILCYFAHPMTTALLIGSIVLLWMLTPRLRYARQLVALVPVLPLMAWFLLQQRHEPFQAGPRFGSRIVALARLDILRTFDNAQLVLGAALMLILATLSIMTIARDRRREENAFLVLAGVVAVLYFVVPAGAAGGLLLPERVMLFIPLLLLPWLTPRLPQVALVATLSIIAAGNALFLAKHDRAVAQRVKAFVRAERAIPAGASVLVLNGERHPDGTFLPLLAHASGYAAVERRLTDLDNYEAATSYFPVKRRPGAPDFDIGAVEMHPENFDADTFAPIADYIFLWSLPHNARLDRLYEPVANGIYRRRDAGQDFAELLLPIAGTEHPIDGPGERWNVEQTIANQSATPLNVHLSTCACNIVLAAGQSRRIASTPDKPFVIARLPKARVRDLRVRTIVERTGDDGSVSIVAVPTMPVASFLQRTFDIPSVPLAARVRLRLWIFGTASHDVTVAAYSEDGRTELKTTALTRPPDGYVTADLARLFEPLRGRVRVRLDAGDDGARLWGFVSETGTGGAPDVLHLPSRL